MKNIAITPAESVIALAGALAGALALSACGQAEEKTYKADVIDESGGELIVTDVDPDAVQVDLPETAMTPIPAETPEEQEPAAPEAPAN